MKTALCVSGLSFGFEEAYPLLKNNLIDTLSPDVFIHTWDVDGQRTPSATDAWMVLKNTVLDEVKKNIIKDIYHPKKIVFEPFYIFDNSLPDRTVSKYVSVPNMLAMFYKIKRCNELKSEYEKAQNFVYDVVIRCRFDMRLETPLSHDDFSECGEWVYIPLGGDWWGLNDQFALSSSYNMDKYSTLFDRINEYCRMGCVMDPEPLMRYHFENMLLPYKRKIIRYRLTGTPRNKDYVLDGSSAFIEKKIWLVPLNKLRSIIKDKTLLALLSLFLFRANIRSGERVFLLTDTTCVCDHKKFDDEIHSIPFFYTVKIIHCIQEDIAQLIDDTCKYFNKMGIPVTLVTKLDIKKAIVLMIMYKISNYLIRYIKKFNTLKKRYFNSLIKRI